MGKPGTLEGTAPVYTTKSYTVIFLSAFLKWTYGLYHGNCALGKGNNQVFWVQLDTGSGANTNFRRPRTSW